MAHRDIAWMFLLTVALSVLSGCTSKPVTEGGPDVLPLPFALELRKVSADHRMTYYVLDADGTLHFGGGRHAGVRNAKRLGKISDAKRMQLWQLTRQHDLLNASGQMFADASEASYEVKVEAGSHRNRFRSVDDRVPGLDRLEAALFEMQAELNYAGVFRPIEAEMKKKSDATGKR